MADNLRLWEIDVAFRRPLATRAGTIRSRSSVIVAVDTLTSTGWAEAPAFPSGRFGTAADAFDALNDPSGWIDGLPTVPIASAALQSARADAAARSAGVPLHEHIGASGDPVPARHPIGLLDPDDTPIEAAWLQSHGVVAVKVKIEPGHDADAIRALREALPHLDIGVDANGAYDDPADPVFSELERLDVSFVEQPFHPTDLASHADLRARSRMAVCLDESVTDLRSAEAALEADAADQVAVKLNRAGPNTLDELRRLCSSAGVGVQLGGTFDTSIGRRHLLAAATLPGVVDAAVGPPAAYLTDDLAPYPPVVGGTVRPEGSPGIGAEPDPAQLDAIASRTSKS